MTETSDQELLDAARAGDRSALEHLLERHQAQVYRFGMKMCRNPEDAKDVLQDTLLAAARGMRDFRGASSLSTWLYTIARSYCIKRHRVGKHAPRHVDTLDEAAAQVADTAKLPDEAVASMQIEQALQAAVAQLEPMYREVLVLRDIEGLTAPEVAEVLGVGVDAVKSRLHRARKTVRDQLAPLLKVPAAPAASSAVSCPDVLTLFSQHLEDEISADTCAAMERHLQSCARCQGTCDSLKRTLALCRTTPAQKVPESVQRSVRAAIAGFLATPA